MCFSSSTSSSFFGFLLISFSETSRRLMLSMKSTELKKMPRTQTQEHTTYVKHSTHTHKGQIYIKYYFRFDIKTLRDSFYFLKLSQIRFRLLSLCCHCVTTSTFPWLMKTKDKQTYDTKGGNGSRRLVLLGIFFRLLTRDEYVKCRRIESNGWKKPFTWYIFLP